MTDADPLSVPYRERERSVTMERLGEQPVSGTEALVESDVERSEELFTLNIGPHHPATHGVLRLLTTLEGEVVRDIKPIIGYVHTGIEKSCEDQQYWKVVTFVERMDYLAYYYNAMAFCMAVERLLDEEVPARAQYLRVIHLELNRIASHLFALATGALDIGAITMLWWGCRDRDLVLDLFEMSSGQRMHTRYFQVGGVMEDIPPGFVEKTREFLEHDAHAPRPVRGAARPQRDLAAAPEGHGDHLPGAGARAGRDRPAAARHRTPVGPAQGDALLAPTSTSTSTCRWARVGDNYDRFKVRIDEMRESIKIVEQALDGLPEGPFITTNRKVALPPRHELATSMEALIHHFKLVTEGFRVPPGEAYAAIESPRGELGCFVVADGSAKPARVHMRDPSFVNLQSLPDMARDTLIADFIACVAMLDPILGGVDR